MFFGAGESMSNDFVTLLGSHQMTATIAVRYHKSLISLVSSANSARAGEQCNLARGERDSRKSDNPR